MQLSQDKKVHILTAKIPKGRVVTYGQIARKLGNPGLARFVGSVLRKNKNLQVLCHRVIRATGDIGEYNRGRKNKEIILRREGVIIKNGKINLSVFRVSL